MHARRLRRLFGGILTATLGIGACSADDDEAEPTRADAGFCSDDRPPEMQNYPGCAPPFCVEVADDARQSDCQTLCGPTVRPVTSCEEFVFDEKPWMKCQMDCTGRRPAGFDGEPRSVAGLGDYFAEMSRLEAASITAFRILARELAEHGAPRWLQRATRRAARDEIRHTRVTRALARRFGGATHSARIGSKPGRRSLEDIAIENAREGCVRETLGALTAMYQSRASTDADVRRALRRIARDEVGHAALAWRVKRWADARLDPAARERVRTALLEEVALLRGAAEDARAGFETTLGLPSGKQLSAFTDALSASLWAPPTTTQSST